VNRTSRATIPTIGESINKFLLGCFAAVRRPVTPHQPHPELRPAIGGKRGRDVSTVQRHDLSADVQTKAHAAAVAHSMRLVKAIKEVGAVLCRDTDPTIAHGEYDPVVILQVHTDIYRPTIW